MTALGDALRVAGWSASDQPSPERAAQIDAEYRAQTGWPYWMRSCPSCRQAMIPKHIENCGCRA